MTKAPLPSVSSVRSIGFMQFLFGMILVPFLLALAVGLVLGVLLQIITGSASLPLSVVTSYNLWPSWLRAAADIASSLSFVSLGAWIGARHLGHRHGPRPAAAVARLATIWAAGYSLLSGLLFLYVVPYATGTRQPLASSDVPYVLLSLTTIVVQVITFYLVSLWSWRQITTAAKTQQPKKP